MICKYCGCKPVKWYREEWVIRTVFQCGATHKTAVGVTGVFDTWKAGPSPLTIPKSWGILDT